ncbi:hypothetical protein Pla52n_67240 [Stieleria varia]|uniref:Uncharacterized protein n=2 Tax=Stieleria varia TaxID=2528005 RepID=A0A5C5ZRQ9_9BACT|nr:hypothetical protein Pla52n_67240 [Stieleria varia]
MDESAYEAEMRSDGTSDYSEPGMGGDSGYEEGYGSGYGSSGYGGPSSRQNAQRGATTQQQFTATLSSLLKQVDLKPLVNPPSDLPPTQAGPVLQGEAETAYKNGNYPLALQLFYGHMATEYDDARVNLQTVKYSPLLRRPVWTIRWGVSFAVRGEGETPNPITDSGPVRMASSGGRGFAGGGNPSEDGSFGPDSSYAEQMGTSESEMEQRMGSGMEDPSMMGMNEDLYGSSGAGRPQIKKAPTFQKPMLSPETDEQLQKYLGLVATAVAEEFEKRYMAGDYGSALTSVSAPADPDAPPLDVAMTPELVELLTMGDSSMLMWKPGLMFVGEGESTDMAKAAATAQIDLLLHFDILLKQPRGGETQNISRVRLIHASSGKTMGTSKAFDSTEAAQLVRVGRSSSRDYIDERLEPFFGIIDRQVKTAALPGLSPEVAKRRVGTLLASGDRNLSTLAEVRLYQFQELLTPEEVEVAFHIVGGEEGLRLLHGSREEKLATAREWALDAVGGDEDR